MEKYLVIIEKAKNNFAAFSPDAWGCIATGETVEETTQLMKEALQLHLESISNDGPLPQPLGIKQHIANGVFNKGEIAEDYFITEVAILVPHHI